MMRWNQQWRVPVAQWQSFAYPFQHVCRASGSICSVPWGAWEIRGVLLRQMPLRVVWWEAVGTCGNTGSCEYTGREKLPWGWSNCREAVGFPSLGVLKAWPSSPNLLSCALRTAWDWMPLPASVIVSVCVQSVAEWLFIHSAVRRFPGEPGMSPSRSAHSFSGSLGTLVSPHPRWRVADRSDISSFLWGPPKRSEVQNVVLVLALRNKSNATVQSTDDFFLGIPELSHAIHSQWPNL